MEFFLLNFRKKIFYLAKMTHYWIDWIYEINSFISNAGILLQFNQLLYYNEMVISLVKNTLLLIHTVTSISSILLWSIFVQNTNHAWEAKQK